MNQQEQREQWPRELALDDRPGPAALLARNKVDDMIFSALDEAGYAPADGRISGISRGAHSAKPGLGAGSLAAAAVLALLSIGSASAAVMWFGRAPKAETKASVVSAPARAPKSATRAAAPEAPSTVLPEPALALPQEEKQAPHKLAPRAPEDWLVEGNRLRAEQRWTKADEAYTRAAQNAPHSQTAYVARVAAAAVRLEHLHDPHGALSSYRTALKQTPNGALSEEIHWGIAEAHRALGERAAERAALALFVREHPSSPLVPQAKARLD